MIKDYWTNLRELVEEYETSSLIIHCIYRKWWFKLTSDERCSEVRIWYKTDWENKDKSWEIADRNIYPTLDDARWSVNEFVKKNFIITDN